MRSKPVSKPPFVSHLWTGIIVALKDESGSKKTRSGMPCQDTGQYGSGSLLETGRLDLKNPTTIR
ncbi:MAG: hypothetical protein OXF20_02935 [Gammaproteobacteria bacterium]|nr:hypothetical protein [Gammaproteobacteria bacterium]